MTHTKLRTLSKSDKINNAIFINVSQALYVTIRLNITMITHKAVGIYEIRQTLLFDEWYPTICQNYWQKQTLTTFSKQHITIRISVKVDQLDEKLLVTVNST